ncbi:MAG TPA: TIGR03620 family F420-dependent LLM class oxidoreductase [Gaiellaceae bacterium]|nr:TIGR03620 family F420-dependent LLM class oxidoreductase [Gaiellaceae bacterium]
MQRDEIRGTRLGRVGVWLGRLGWMPAAVEREASARIESLGFGTLWYSESHSNKEALSHGALLLAATERITVASGIANVYARDPTAAAAGANALAEAYPGRFLLGLGVSHPTQVAPRGHEYRSPVATMRDYLDAMDAAGYEGPTPAEPFPRVLAALRPRMLELAAQRADGAHPYLVTVEHTRRARELLGNGPLLAPEQFVLLEPDASAARDAARTALSWYLQQPNYANALRWLGFGDEDLAPIASDRLVDALVAWGDEEAVAERVRAHLEAGADHVCVQPIGRGRDELGLDQLDRLAPALLAL